MNNETQAVDLGTLEKLSQKFRKEYTTLVDRCQKLNDELEATKRRKLEGIKNAAARANEAKSELEQAVACAPHLFQKPKTMVIAGIRIGVKKEKGRIIVADPQSTIKLIRKHLPDLFDQLVSTRETPLKSGLQQLTGAELKKIGVELEADTDAVVVRSTDSDVDKIVNALLDEAEQWEKAA